MPQTNNTSLTAAFCLNNRLIFRPRSEEEALFIQERLSAFGIRWVNGDPVGTRVAECARHGMIVDEGKLFYNPRSEEGSILCTADQFGAEYIPPDKRFLMEQFNKLSAKIDVLTEKVDRLYAELHPEMADTKPGLKKPTQRRDP